MNGDSAGTGIADERLQDVVDPFLAAEDGAAEHPALPVHVLGAGIDDDVGPHCQRLLQQWGGEDVVDHDDGAGFMREVRDRREVDHFQHRVGGGFQQDQVGGARQGGFPLGEVAAVDEFRCDAELRQQGGDDPVTGPEQGA